MEACMRVPWLGDVLRDAGLTVLTPVGNPIGRGRAMRTVYGICGHDTVTTTAWTDARVDQLLRDGRAGLPGPLAQLGMDRRGRYRWIADGRCNHNGFGTWGNDCIGIEVYAAGGLAGRQESWNGAQREAFVIGARAILDYLNLGRSSHWNPRVAGHKETDPRRKIDPWGVDMAAIRRQVASRVTIQEEGFIVRPEDEATIRRIVREEAGPARVWSFKGTDNSYPRDAWWLQRQLDGILGRLAQIRDAVLPGGK